MPYGVETHRPGSSYSVSMTHVATGYTTQIWVSFDPTQASTEAQRDALFQSFLTRISGMNGMTVESAAKTGNYTTPVTP